MNSEQIQSQIDALLDELSEIERMTLDEVCDRYNVDSKEYLTRDIAHEIRQLDYDLEQALISEESDDWYAGELADRWYKEKRENEYELFNN